MLVLDQPPYECIIASIYDAVNDHGNQPIKNEKIVTTKNHCSNYNHRRTNPPVRSCPTCGAIVNHTIPIQSCQEEKHARAQRNRDKFCVDCGQQFSVEKQK